MMIAQQLYEGIDLGGKQGTTGLITYMRTDSTRLSNSAKDDAKQYIENNFGSEYLGNSNKTKKQEGAQDAHEAIRPTGADRDPKAMKSILSRDQYRLYKLVWDRFVSSQMAPAVLDTMTVHLYNQGVEFRATGSEVKFKGFMKVYIEGRDDNKKEKR